jgi:hypothetical protein
MLGARREDRRRYIVEPTAQRFHASPHLVRGLMGPIGSGKSVACVNEVLRRIFQQRPGHDGIRRSRWAILRNTYPELRTTTLNTWKQWVDPSWASYRMDSPITCRIRVNDVDAEVYFIALDRPDDVKKLLSLELTGGWGNEARELSFEVIRGLIGRIGRYPSKAGGGSNFTGILLDTNPPDTDHWWYKKFEVEQPEGWALFKQPGGLIRVSDGIYRPNPAAENIRNLNGGHDYYMRQVPGNDTEWLKVYVLGEYGSVMDGKPVYPEYRDSVHCSPTRLDVYRGIPLFVGFDYGRTPAAILLQYTPRGQLRVLEELVVDTDGDGMGIRSFMRDAVMPHIRNNYGGIPVIARGDPAGGSKDGNDWSCFDIQGQEGMSVEAAASNDPVVRIDAVAKHLKSMVDGEPGFLLDPRCSILRKGFLGGYKYERVRVSGEDRHKDVPCKNRFSHPHDALQYGALGVAERNSVVTVRARPVGAGTVQGLI